MWPYMAPRLARDAGRGQVEVPDGNLTKIRSVRGVHGPAARVEAGLAPYPASQLRGQTEESIWAEE
jgi:hypothetical protein